MVDQNVIGDYRPLRVRSMLACAAIGLSGLLALAELGLVARGLSSVDAVQRSGGFTASPADATAVVIAERIAGPEALAEGDEPPPELTPAERAYGENEAMRMAHGLGAVAVYLSAAVLFSMWFYRAYRNVSTFMPGKMRQSPGWAVGSFYVPIANVYVPVRAMKDAWNACHQRVDFADAEGWKKAPVPTDVALWWGLWLGMNAAGRVASKMEGKAESADELVAGLYASGGAAVVSLLAAAACVAVVRRLSRVQTTLFETPDPTDQRPATA